MAIISKLNMVYILWGGIITRFVIDPELRLLESKFAENFPPLAFLSSLFGGLLVAISLHIILHNRGTLPFIGWRTKREISELKKEVSTSPDLKDTIEGFYGNFFLAITLTVMSIAYIYQYMRVQVEAMSTILESLSLPFISIKIKDIMESVRVPLITVNTEYIIIGLFASSTIMWILTKSSAKEMNDRLEWLAFYRYFINYDFYRQRVVDKNEDALKQKEWLDEYRSYIRADWGRVEDIFLERKLALNQDLLYFNTRFSYLTRSLEHLESVNYNFDGTNEEKLLKSFDKFWTNWNNKALSLGHLDYHMELMMIQGLFPLLDKLSLGRLLRLFEDIKDLNSDKKALSEKLELLNKKSYDPSLSHKDLALATIMKKIAVLERDYQTKTIKAFFDASKKAKEIYHSEFREQRSNLFFLSPEKRISLDSLIDDILTKRKGYLAKVNKVILSRLEGIKKILDDCRGKLLTEEKQKNGLLIYWKSKINV